MSLDINISKTTVCNIRQFETSRDGKVANVLAMVGNRIETASAYDQKLRALTGGKVELVPGSLRCVGREVASAQPAVAFHARAVREVRPYTEAASMRTVVEANVFQDHDSAIWSVVEANGVKSLVKQSDTDISALLQAVANTNIQMVAASTYNADTMEGFRNGNFVLFASTDSGEIDGGVAARGDDGQLHVVSLTSNDVVTIDDAQVVANSAFSVVSEEGDNETEVATIRQVVVASPLDAQARSRMVDFYSTLYSKHPDFWAKLKSQIAETIKP